MADKIRGLRLENKRRADQSRANLVGKTFNWLTINEVHSPHVLCTCVCGNTKKAQRSDVVSGKTTSCGCMRKTKLQSTLKDKGLWIDRTGERFGNLELIDKRGDRYLCRCTCGSEKEVFVGNLLNGDIKSCGCSSVTMRQEANLAVHGSRTVSVNISKGEKEVFSFIKDLGLDPSREDIPADNVNETYELDIVIKSKGIAIEYCGARWHSDLFRKDNHYHYNKMIAAQKAGYRLIQIFDFEWMQRKTQVKSFLTSVLGLNSKTIGARSLDIRVCEFGEIKGLLEKTHILGAVAGKFYIGCFYKGEAIAAGVFSKHHVKNTGCVLSRWVVKQGISAPGALRKVSALARSIFGESVVTWVDRRFSEGKGFLNAGWKHDSTLRPDYFYFDPRQKKVIYKNQRRKRKANTPADMTERQHAVQDGLYRIWDCGKIRLIFD